MLEVRNCGLFEIGSFFISIRNVLLSPTRLICSERVRFIDSEELAYVMQRYREVHDFWHVLTGLDTTVLDELGLKALEYLQTGMEILGCWCCCCFFLCVIIVVVVVVVGGGGGGDGDGGGGGGGVWCVVCMVGGGWLVVGG
jgi:hypothetical protein